MKRRTTGRDLQPANRLPGNMLPTARSCLAAATIVAWAAVWASAQEKDGGLNAVAGRAGGADAQIVDFRYAPPEWQSAICLPDDPYKSLVDHHGDLLYHYGQGGREFATRIAVEVIGGATWKRQELLSPRVPIVRTYETAPGLEIVEEAFAVTSGPSPQRPGPGTCQEHGP